MPIQPPEIVETTPGLTAFIRLTIPRRDMMAQFGPTVQELLAGLAAQNITPAGPVFAHHLAMSPDIFDFELGVQVETAPQPAGRLQAGVFPAARMARTVHEGGYEGLFGAWVAFMAWMQAKNLALAGDLWEFYAVGPHATGDQALWRTVLLRPLAAA